MVHLGNICEINGAEVEKVDCITFGSPCQDVSVAGQRKGVLHEDRNDEETTRSGLFYEAMRIIKEMREDDINNGRTNDSARPRFGLLENVPGLLSSNQGEDFRCVLEAFCKIIDKDAVVPRLEKGQKWSPSGCILVERGSIAWRLTDAQYHGVPQRRRRLAVLGDFNGYEAARILFDPQLERRTESGEPYSTVRDIGRRCRSEVQPLKQGLSRDTEPSKQTRQETAGDTSEGT